jgi:hypothetical protein
MLTDFPGHEAKLFFEKKNQNGGLKKTEISTPQILDFFFAKISWPSEVTSKKG